MVCMMYFLIFGGVLTPIRLVMEEPRAATKQLLVVIDCVKREG